MSKDKSGEISPLLRNRRAQVPCCTECLGPNPERGTKADAYGSKKATNLRTSTSNLENPYTKVCEENSCLKTIKIRQPFLETEKTGENSATLQAQASLAVRPASCTLPLVRVIFKITHHQLESVIKPTDPLTQPNMHEPRIRKDAAESQWS